MTPIGNSRLNDNSHESWAVCPGCSLLCDDIRVVDIGAEYPQIKGTCPRGQAWFDRQSATRSHQCFVAGVPTTLDLAVEAAATILREASATHIYGMDYWPLAAQQRAVELARLTNGACVCGSPSGPRDGDSVLRTIGRVTSTLGVVNALAEVVIFWYADPSTSHPRLIERFCQGARRIVVIHDGDLATKVWADPRMESWQMERHMANRLLECWQKQQSQSANALELPVETEALPQHAFGEQLWRARGSAWFVTCRSTESMGTEHDQHIDWKLLHQLVRALNHVSRSVLLTLTDTPNSTGCQHVMSWSFGNPQDATFDNSGLTPRPFSHSDLARSRHRSPDVVVGPGLVYEQIPRPGDLFRAGFRQIVLDTSVDSWAVRADVAIAVGQVGWDNTGEYCRFDNQLISLPQLVTSSRPSITDILTRLTQSL